MTIEKVTGIPKRRLSVKRTLAEATGMLDDIIGANVKYGKITFGNNEYLSIYSGYASLKNSAITKGYPLKFTMRNGELYFVRLDM